VFNNDRTGSLDVWVMGADGTKLRDITPGGRVSGCMQRDIERTRRMVRLADGGWPEVHASRVVNP